MNLYDPLITRLAEYALAELTPSDEALNTASLCLMDSLGCGILALDFPECTRLLGPQFSEDSSGCPIPGTPFRLNPLEAAFNISCMNRWLDFNDTWLALEWGHPSDNLGALLAAANHQNLLGITLSMHELLIYLIKAYEIQGLLAEDNAFNRVGLDHVILVKVASTACAGAILGLNLDQLRAAISQAWIDGQSLRTYRHAPNTGARKSWAAGDAATHRHRDMARWSKRDHVVVRFSEAAAAANSARRVWVGPRITASSPHPQQFYISVHLSPSSLMTV